MSDTADSTNEKPFTPLSGQTPETKDIYFGYCMVPEKDKFSICVIHDWYFLINSNPRSSGESQVKIMGADYKGVLWKECSYIDMSAAHGLAHSMEKYEHLKKGVINEDTLTQMIQTAKESKTLFQYHKEIILEALEAVLEEPKDVAAE